MNESMQRYTAHAAEKNALEEMKANLKAMIKTSDELGFSIPVTKAMTKKILRLF